MGAPPSSYGSVKYRCAAVGVSPVSALKPPTTTVVTGATAARFFFFFDGFFFFLPSAAGGSGKVSVVNGAGIGPGTVTGRV